MRKMNLEKVTGVVALSYLILIPVGMYYLRQKVRIMDQDVIALCEHSGITPTDANSIDTARKSVARFLSNK